VEHAGLLLWAVANAVCEEVTSRGVWRIFFEQVVLRATGTASSMMVTNVAKLNVHSNIFQAAVFGLWHYHGIPSGVVGVGLTFLYGLIMGGLSDYNDGLGLAMVAHSVADYYIFAAIARRQLLHNDAQQPRIQKDR
jgi:membrane protease YdiL (CAAX protease family)